MLHSFSDHSLRAKLRPTPLSLYEMGLWQVPPRLFITTPAAFFSGSSSLSPVIRMKDAPLEELERGRNKDRDLFGGG
jgi:hypothetical protein